MTMTRDELISEARINNPKPQFCTTNDTQYLLTDEEYEESLQNWVDMRLAQIAEEGQQ